MIGAPRNRFTLTPVAIALALSFATSAQALDVIVQFDHGEPTTEVLEYAVVLDSIRSTGAFLMRIDDADLERLQDAHGVEFAEPNEPFQDLECQQSVVWMTDFAPPIYDYPAPAADAVRLALLDSAVDGDHVTFRNQLRPGLDLIDWDGSASLPDAEAGRPETDMRAGQTHATASAGVVAAVAPSVWIVPYRVMDDECRGTIFHLSRGIIHAVDDGAAVVLIPLGGSKSSGALKQALDYAKQADVVVIVSAGNTGGMMKDKPAKDKSVLAIAAVNADGTPADFTSYSPHVSLSDYGVRLETAYPGGRRTFASGTSFAAARTAAAAAALRAARPELSAKQVRDLLAKSAAPLGPRPSSLKNKMGEGITDLDAALHEQ